MGALHQPAHAQAADPAVDLVAIFNANAGQGGLTGFRVFSREAWRAYRDRVVAAVYPGYYYVDEEVWIRFDGEDLLLRRIALRAIAPALAHDLQALFVPRFAVFPDPDDFTYGEEDGV